MMKTQLDGSVIAAVGAALLLFAGTLTADASTPPDFIGPPVPPPSVPVSRPPPPTIQPLRPSDDPETVMPQLAPAAGDKKKGEELGSVTCFACPPGQDVFHGTVCMNGVACAAETVTLQRLNINQPASPAITAALRKLEAARAELKKPKGQSKKALQYINTAVVELKAAGLKAGCKSR
jgi:hypothetical protein